MMIADDIDDMEVYTLMLMGGVDITLDIFTGFSAAAFTMMFIDFQIRAFMIPSRMSRPLLGQNTVR